MNRKKLLTIKRKEKKGTNKITTTILLKYGKRIFLGFIENNSVINLKLLKLELDISTLLINYQ